MARSSEPHRLKASCASTVPVGSETGNVRLGFWRFRLEPKVKTWGAGEPLGDWLGLGLGDGLGDGLGLGLGLGTAPSASRALRAFTRPYPTFTEAPDWVRPVIGSTLEN